MIIKGNQLEDINRTRFVHTVVKAGKVFDSKTAGCSLKGSWAGELI